MDKVQKHNSFKTNSDSFFTSGCVVSIRTQPASRHTPNLQFSCLYEPSKVTWANSCIDIFPFNCYSLRHLWGLHSVRS